MFWLDITPSSQRIKPTDDCLMGQGITVELQFPIDKCRADFLINDCLIVEIDGAAYHSSKDARARERETRDAINLFAVRDFIFYASQRSIHSTNTLPQLTKCGARSRLWRPKKLRKTTPMRIVYFMWELKIAD